MSNVARRLRGLTRRQAAAAAVVVALVIAIGIATSVGQQRVTTLLLALLVLVVFAALLQVRKRVGEADGRGRLVLGEVRSMSARQAKVAERLEFGLRRILASVENERLAASERHQKGTAEAQEMIVKSARTSVERIVKTQRDQTREVEALLQLFRGFEPRVPMPSSGRWAMNPTDLLELLFLIDRKRPQTVLELGGGTSSVWIAYALEKSGGRIVSVDHERRFADRTRALLAAHGLEGVAEVRDAPLRPLRLAGEEFQWYDTQVLDDVVDVDFLVVDGPPGSVGPDARYPAFPVLEPKLAATATLVLDDADRPDEQDVVRRWTDAFPGLVRDLEIVGKQAVFAYSRPS